MKDSRWQSISKKIIKAEENIIIVLFTIMTIIIASTVFTRFVFSYTPTWSEQLARLILVWVTFIGISLAVVRKMHLRVSILPLLLPKRWSNVVSFIGDFLTLIVGLLLVYKTIGIIQVAMYRGQVFPTLTAVPVWVMYLAAVLGLTGLVVHLIEVSILPTLSDWFSKKKAS